MRDVYIIGAHTLKFGKYPNLTIKNLTAEVVQGVLKDAGIDKHDLQSVFFSNAAWGMQNYQHCIRGQVALRPIGIDTIPITNVENACASASTALHGAYKDVAGGFCDISLAVGVEKLVQPNRFAVFASFLAATDVSEILNEAQRLQGNLVAPEGSESKGDAKQKKSVSLTDRIRGRARDIRDQAVVGIQLGEAIGYDTVRQLVKFGGGDRSPFMDIYAFAAREHMRKYGSTQKQLAIIASKNHWHSSMNPNAQYTFEVSPEQVLADRVVAPPLTRGMCAPIGDGAAAAIIVSERKARELGLSGKVRVLTSVLRSGWDRNGGPGLAEVCAREAFEEAGLGPNDMSVVELHDASAPAELLAYESIGLCAKGEGGRLIAEGATRLGGRIPVSTSGGLLRKGHPVGATGIAQVVEVTEQLQGRAGARQVRGARLGLCHNGGGSIGDDAAALCATILAAA